MDDLVGIAIAYLHLTVFEFYDLTPKEFKKALDWYNKEQVERVHLMYEVARFTLKHQWNMAGKQLKHALKKVEDVEVFPWEQNNSKLVTMSNEQMATALKSIFRSYQNMQKKQSKDKPVKK